MFSVVLLIFFLYSCQKNKMPPAEEKIPLQFKVLSEDPDPRGLLTLEIVVDSIDSVRWIGFEFLSKIIKFKGKKIAEFLYLNPYQRINRDFIYASISEDEYFFLDELYSPKGCFREDGIYFNKVSDYDSKSPVMLYIKDGKISLSDMKSDTADRFVGYNIIWAYAYPRDRKIEMRIDRNNWRATYGDPWRYVNVTFNY